MSSLTYSLVALDPCPPQPGPFGVGRQFRDRDVLARLVAFAPPLRRFGTVGTLPK